MKKWVVVDVESNGPCPGLYSMISLGAIVLDRKLDTIFFGQFAPLPVAQYQLEAYSVVGVTPEEHAVYPNPEQEITRFFQWVNASCTDGAIFVSDNPAFDFPWVNYYGHKFCGENPFGWSGRRIGDLWAGLNKNVTARWKNKLRKTKHTHHPVDDAKGNAEALLTMIDMGLRIPGVL